MAKTKEAADFYRGLMILTLFAASVFTVGALCAAAGWAVGLSSAAALSVAWGLLFWGVARAIEKGETNAG